MDLTNSEIRFAAESLLASTSGYNSQSINSMEEETIVPSVPSSYPPVSAHSLRREASRPSSPFWHDIVISEDLIGGQRVDGKMSNVRRFFCLFVTFDLLFTCLMWLICVMLSKINFQTALSLEVLHYNIHTSLFDIVMAATCRFTVLLLFYALLYLKHWLIIAISTAGTCAFLICKVFVFEWDESPQPVFQVLLILASFILAWGEAWFFDFRVTPQEAYAARYLVTRTSERAPLIRSFRFTSSHRGLAVRRSTRMSKTQSNYTDSVRDFYSPLQSPDDSLHSDDFDYHLAEPRISVTEEEELLYKAQGLMIMEESWKLLNGLNWKVNKQSPEGDTVETTHIPKVGKVFRLTGVVNIPPRYLLDELFYRIEDIPLWNMSVLESRKMYVIDEYTDISYQVSPDAGGGMISSRDFVSLRHWGIIDGCYVSASVSIEHPEIPKTEYIRGENGVGCWVMRPINEEPNKCVFQWMLNTNLKGWIPQYVIDASLTSVMFDYLNDLRKYSTYLKSSGQIP